MAAYLPIGERIAIYRRRRGLSQIRLGGLIDRSEDWVSKAERGDIPLDRLSVLVRVADALHVRLSDLLRDVTPLDEDDNADSGAVRGLRRYLARLTPTGAGAERELEPLAADLAAATRLRADGRYVDLGAMLPTLLADLEDTVVHDPAARSLLAHAYCEGEVLSSSHGAHDLAWICAARAVATAEQVGDPVLRTEAAFWLTHAHLGAGRRDEAIMVANDGMTRAAPDADDPAVRSLIGAIHLPLGIALTRQADTYGAEDAFAEAAGLAGGGVPAVVDTRTQFGMPNVALHQISSLVELGRPAEALRLAERLDAAPLPASRQARLWTDIALAHAQRRDDEHMTHALQVADRISPESVRHVPMVKEMVYAALRRERGHANERLHALADRVGVT